MSSRENITKKIVELTETIRYVTNVTRDPVDITELSRESFPHVFIETANEVREHASFGDGTRRVSDLDILLNIVVMGDGRDSQRNLIIEAMERKFAEDPTLGGLAYDSFIDEVNIREINESGPYGQAAVIFRVRYFYNATQP